MGARMGVPSDSEVARRGGCSWSSGSGTWSIQLLAFSLDRATELGRGDLPVAGRARCRGAAVRPLEGARHHVPRDPRAAARRLAPAAPALPRRRLGGGADRGVPHVGAGDRLRRRRGRGAVRRGVAGPVLRVRADAEPLGRVGRASPRPPCSPAGSRAARVGTTSSLAGGLVALAALLRPLDAVVLTGRARPAPDRRAAGDGLLDRPSRARARRRVGALAGRDGRAVRVTRGGVRRGGAPRAHGAMGRCSRTSGSTSR